MHVTIFLITTANSKLRFLFPILCFQYFCFVLIVSTFSCLFLTFVEVCQQMPSVGTPTAVFKCHNIATGGVGPARIISEIYKIV